MVFSTTSVTFSECIEVITLLTPYRRENVFSRLASLRLLADLVEFFERDIVKPTHYRRYVLCR